MNKNMELSGRKQISLALSMGSDGNFSAHKQSSTGTLGERHQLHFSQQAKRFPTLVPVSISNQLEFYLGVRPDKESARYDGARLYYDSEEFGTCIGSTPYHVN